MASVDDNPGDEALAPDPRLPDRRPGRDEIVGFEALQAPQPTDPAPDAPARLGAFAATVAGGLLGGLIGYGVADLLGPGTEESIWPAVGGLLGAVIGAVGVGVIANLTLQAMAEWRSVDHPEAGRGTAANGGRRRIGRTRTP